MDKKDWTPGELELKEALDKVYENDTRMPSRPLDLSFIDNPPVEKKPSKKRTYLLRIAAVAAIILVTSITTAIFVSNDYASAVQDKLQRKVFEMKHGIVVATDEEFAEEGETVWEITDFDTAVKAKELVPELPIPEYVPEGYEFEKLVLHLFDDGRYLANYEYTYNTHILLITCQTSSGDMFNTSMFNITKTIKLTDRTIYSSKDSIARTATCITILDDSVITITSFDNIITDDNLIKICTSIE